MLRRFLLVTFALLLAAPAAFAQQGTSDVRGRVIDQQGGSLPGVTVVVRHQESGLFRETVTGPDGLFLMSAMTPGVYEVSAELQGFKKYAQRDVRLEVGRTAQVELKLEVGGVTEAVTVSSEAPLVERPRQEIGGRISAQEFVDTPSFNRNFRRLSRHVAGCRGNDFSHDLRRRLYQRCRTERAQRQLHDGRVEQQRHVQRRQRRRSGARSGRGRAGVSAPDESVRRRIRPRIRRHRQFGLEIRHESVPRQCVPVLPGREAGRQRVFRTARRDSRRRRPSSSNGAARLADPIVRDKAHYFASLERVALDGGVTTNIPTRPDLNRTDFETSRVWNTYPAR